MKDKCYIFFLSPFIFSLYASNYLPLDQYELAEHFYQEAHQFVQQNNNYESALASFRTACRLNNQSANYWTDLGVTEMRLRQYTRAKKRFAKALQINENFKPAKDNLDELSKYMNEYDFFKEDDNKKSILEERQHHIKTIPIITLPMLDHFLSNQFGRKSSNPHIMHHPFVLKQYFNASIKTLSDLQFIIQQQSNSIIDFYPHNMIEEQVHPFRHTLGAAYHQLLHGINQSFLFVDASDPGTYIQWNLDEESWQRLLNALKIQLFRELDTIYWVTECFSTQSMMNQFFVMTHWKMLIIGEQHAGMFHHQDTLRTASWQLQLVGRKTWHLCANDQSQYLYKPGEVDMFRPNYDLYPNLRKASCYEVTVEPGDLIYYPSDYWHQTVNHDTPSMALSNTLIMKENYRRVYEELKKECNGLGRIFPPDPTICDVILTVCYQTWSNIFAGRNRNVVGDEDL